MYHSYFEEMFTKKCDENLRNKFKKAINDSFFFVNTGVIGRSVLNRPIDCYTIGNKPEKIFLCGGVHGMEWITSHILYMFIINISYSIINHKPILNLNLWKYFTEKSLVVVPCVNPDGVEISINGSDSAKSLKNFVEKISNGDTLHWQSNVLGVDINHNFNAGWSVVKEKEIAKGITSPAKTRYGGECPESQPETIALTEFCRNNRISAAVAFHSQGEEIYWDYGENTPPQSLGIANKMAELSGYTVAEPEDIAVGGGFKDWVIEELHIPAFTIEVGKGKNPLDISQLLPIYAKIEKMLIYMLTI
ncbi:MAG: M14 family metallocarboxypeptidase [Acutalibacteraceae bacterium]|nr:M14 family metallocarboxypeptidase [Acutalibacteraceae bacterium]